MTNEEEVKRRIAVSAQISDSVYKFEEHLKSDEVYFYNEGNLQKLKISRQVIE